MPLPCFTRAQQGVVLCLGVGLLGVWAWRAGCGGFWAAAPVPVRPPVFVEVAGEVGRPGVYAVPQGATLKEVLRQAQAGAFEAARSEIISSGTLVEVRRKGDYHVRRMSGPRLLALGLAVDVNRASQSDLEALPGVGPTLAARIIDHRHRYGPFNRVDDLEKVPGLGPRKVAQLKPFLVISGPNDTDGAFD